MRAKNTNKTEVEERRKREEEEALKLLHEPHPDPIARDPLIRYVAECVVPCTFRGRYWRAGDEYRGFAAPPEHFVIAGQIDEGMVSETPRPRLGSPDEAATEPNEPVTEPNEPVTEPEPVPEPVTEPEKEPEKERTNKPGKANKPAAEPGAEPSFD
jgi:hypothetical protein